MAEHQLTLDLVHVIVVLRDGTVIERHLSAGATLVTHVRLTAGNGHDYDIPVVRLGGNARTVVYREGSGRRHLVTWASAGLGQGLAAGGAHA